MQKIFKLSDIGCNIYKLTKYDVKRKEIKNDIQLNNQVNKNPTITDDIINTTINTTINSSSDEDIINTSINMTINASIKLQSNSPPLQFTSIESQLKFLYGKLFPRFEDNKKDLNETNNIKQQLDNTNELEIYKLDNNGYNKEFFDYVLSIGHMINQDDNNDICIIKGSQTFDINPSKLYYQTLNSNLSYLNMTTLNWINTIQRINSMRLIGIYNNKHALNKISKLKEFINEIKYLDPEITKNIIIYSGAALVFYGITYTDDIDILIFNMTYDEIKYKIVQNISITNIDICYFYNNKFYSYTDGKNKYNIHHNSKTLMQMIKGTFINTNVLFESLQVKIILDTDYISNYLLENTIYITGIRIMTLDALDKYYLFRYENAYNICSRHYILLDMYYLRTYARSNKFKTTTPYSKDELKKFRSKLKEYHEFNIIPDKTHAITILDHVTDSDLF